MTARRAALALTLLLIAAYASYLAFVIGWGGNTLDYGAFLTIGGRFINHQPIWTGNSYYPLPMVMIFALFAVMPHAPALIAWHAAPVLFALWISRR